MTYATDRWSGLDFRVALPETWMVEMPATGEPDFGASPAWFLPLLRATSADGCLRLDIGARPMRSGDWLVDRATALLAHQGIELEAPLDPWPMDPFTGLCGRGETGHAAQRRTVRVAFLDEGGRAVQLLFAGQAACVDALQALWPAILRSFRLVPRPVDRPLAMPAAWTAVERRSS